MKPKQAVASRRPRSARDVPKAPRRRWNSDPVPTLKTADANPEHRIDLDLSRATLRPDPVTAIRMLRGRFLRRGLHHGDRDVPALQIRDVVAMCNYVTSALHHDLPTPDRRDSAVLWNKWRNAVLRYRPNVRGAPASALYPDPREVLAYVTALAEDFARALATPGEVARHYCPWAADFFTPRRLNPEAR